MKLVKLIVAICVTLSVSVFALERTANKVESDQFLLNAVIDPVPFLGALITQSNAGTYCFSGAAQSSAVLTYDNPLQVEHYQFTPLQGMPTATTRFIASFLPFVAGEAAVRPLLQ